MHSDHNIFSDAIDAKRKVRLIFVRDIDGSRQELVCAPMFYGPAQGSGDNCYHFCNYDGYGYKNSFCMPAEKIVNMELSEEGFSPFALLIKTIEQKKKVRTEQGAETQNIV